MNSYEWLFFDADNTLFDFNAAEEYALTRTLLRFGAPNVAPVRECFHKINRDLWDFYEKGEISREKLVFYRFTLLLQALKTEGDPVQWNEFYKNALAQCSTLMPGAEPLCRRAAQKYKLCLITNGSAEVQRKRLHNSPLKRYFEGRVFISEEMGCHKPEKKFFDMALSAVGARTQRGKVLVIGDSLSSDIKGAFNAQLDSVWLHSPTATAPAGAIKPTYEVENLAQLTEFLNAHRMLPMKPY